MDERDERSLHMLGMHGSAYANYAVQASDLLICIGARFDDRATGMLGNFAPEARKAEAEGRGGIVHFDVCPKQIGKVVPVTMGVIGDATKNMTALMDYVEPKPRDAWFQQLNEWKKLYPFAYDKSEPGGIMKPQEIIEELYKQTKDRDDIIITTGVGQHQMWAAQFYRWTQPRSFITSGGLGTMGFGVPSAIGAKMAQPHKTVVDIDGDASFMMTGMELATAAQYDIGVKILILNNHFQGMVKQWQDLFYDERYSHTTMFNPDFANLANALGCGGITCTKAENLEDAMDEFLSAKGPVVLDALVCKGEHVYPMVPAGKALHEMVLVPEQERMRAEMAKSVA
eukprot:GFYU01004731.1.p1 GENE.GFYU01004731.1~~GFYU01004731.1.p1  ORF type:complete len:377 (-),score=158.55 GFYU01004731.1:358-1380(-)